MTTRARNVISAAIVAGLLLPAAPALAQSDEQQRIRKLEAEVSALQRRVFPGGDGRYFEPEIGGTSQGTTVTAGTPSTTALTDILARLDAMEASLQTLTGQVEVNANTLQGLTTRMAALEQGGAAPTLASASTPTPTPTASSPSQTSTTTANNLTAMTGGASSQPARPPAASGPSSQRLAAVQAIAKPKTDDAGDDEYSYGFRLWDAGYYPEAQQQLTLFVEQYPDHWRATYGRNLLGRAYLDDGKAREAAPWFLNNYQADRNAARSPDSLLYLAESMIALRDTDRACIALAEFGETYPAVAAGRLQSQYEANRAKVTCTN